MQILCKFYTSEAAFSQIRDLHRKIENHKIFHFRLLSAKVMPEFLEDSKKPYF